MICLIDISNTPILVARELLMKIVFIKYFRLVSPPGPHIQIITATIRSRLHYMVSMIKMVM